MRGTVNTFFRGSIPLEAFIIIITNKIRCNLLKLIFWVLDLQNTNINVKYVLNLIL